MSSPNSRPETDLNLDESPAIRDAREFLADDDVETEVAGLDALREENEIEFEDDPGAPNRTLFSDGEETTDDERPPPPLAKKSVVYDSSDSEDDSDFWCRTSLYLG